ncbi:MAG: 6,7-dimethyl-8-ribityllumazine synthase [Elusimicrobia bacterium]|nr:6,7-dimethyl-8-ribityllumazine synthase [Elusimicrobiota bacterium]
MKRAHRIAVAASRFNAEVTDRLLASCLRTLAHGGVPARSVKVVRVPGGFELPWAVSRLASSRRYDAVVALGCVLRGSTPQNDHISRSVVDALQRAAVESGVPVVLGVITPNTWAQALARTRGALDRGKEAAEAALAMAALKRTL